MALEIIGWQPRRYDRQIAILPPTASKWIYAIYPTKEEAERHAYGGWNDEHPLYVVRPVYAEGGEI